MSKNNYSPIPKTEEVRHLEEHQDLIRQLGNLTLSARDIAKKGKSERQARKKLRNYYNFLCKCQEKFSTFSEFLDHVKDSHRVRNLNFSEILARKNGSK